MIARLGAAAFINQVAMLIVQIVMNNTLRYYGANSIYGSDIPLACVGVIMKVNMIFMAICIGISQGCQPIWGLSVFLKAVSQSGDLITVQKILRECVRLINGL